METEPTLTLVASLLSDRESKSLSRQTLRQRFRTSCKVLGKERLASLTIYHGRHTFISHALAGGRTLAEVRDAAAHANVTVTSSHLHAVVDDQKRRGCCSVSVQFGEVGQLAEVRDASGHSNVSITSSYLHVAVEDEWRGSLFG